MKGLVRVLAEDESKKPERKQAGFAQEDSYARRKESRGSGAEDLQQAYLITSCSHT